MTTVRWEFPCDLASPARARRLVRELLADRPYAHALGDDAELLVSEVVANVVRHAGTEAQLTVRVGAHGLRVEVEDHSPRLPTIPCSFTDGDPDLREAGRGLALVETVAQAWGVERSGDGKVVWFELMDPDDRVDARDRFAYTAG